MDLGQKGLKGLFQGVERRLQGSGRLSCEWLMARTALALEGLAGRMLFVSFQDGNQIPVVAIGGAAP